MTINLPKLIGHRGVRNLAPENTLQSINQAIQLNIKWVEVDVKISKDHIPFLLHDDNLDRTTSGSGNPIKYKYKDILKLDAGSWFGSRYKNLYPPTLHEVLNFCSQKNIGVNIELKPNKGFEKENVEAVVKLIKNFNFSCEQYFSSFNWFSVILLKKLLPKSHVGILIESLNKKNDIIKILNKCKKYNFFSCGLNTKFISIEIVELCKNYGMQITAYSSENIKIIDANNLWDIGVDSIFIGNPLNYRNILK